MDDQPTITGPAHNNSMDISRHEEVQEEIKNEKVTSIIQIEEGGMAIENSHEAEQRFEIDQLIRSYFLLPSQAKINILPGCEIDLSFFKERAHVPATNKYYRARFLNLKTARP